MTINKMLKVKETLNACREANGKALSFAEDVAKHFGKEIEVDSYELHEERIDEAIQVIDEFNQQAAEA